VGPWQALALHRIRAALSAAGAVTARWFGARHKPADMAAMVVAGLCNNAVNQLLPSGR